MNVSVRTITTGDLPLLKSFVDRAGDSLVSFRYFAKRPFTVIGNHLVTALLMEDGAPVGYGHLDPDAGRVWLGIAIQEASRGKGYGKKMMDFLVSDARKKSIATLHLTVDMDNTTAIDLYKKFGFEIVEAVNDRSVLMKLQPV
jgi:ribosomal protein S18 acetylase RimI-like enzyme